MKRKIFYIGCFLLGVNVSVFFIHYNGQQKERAKERIDNADKIPLDYIDYSNLQIKNLEKHDTSFISPMDIIIGQNRYAYVNLNAPIYMKDIYNRGMSISPDYSFSFSFPDSTSIKWVLSKETVPKNYALIDRINIIGTTSKRKEPITLKPSEEDNACFYPYPEY